MIWEGLGSNFLKNCKAMHLSEPSLTMSPRGKQFSAKLVEEIMKTNKRMELQINEKTAKILKVENKQ